MSEQDKNTKKSLSKIDLDNLPIDITQKNLSEIYNIVVEQLKDKSEFELKDMALINFIKAVHEDKIELMKFLKTHELKEKEFELKKQIKDGKPNSFSSPLGEVKIS